MNYKTQMEEKYKYEYEGGSIDLPEEYKEIIQKVNDEYGQSEEFVLNKRELFESRQKLYMSITDQQNKVYIRLIFAVIDTLKALYNQDKPTVTFAGIQLGDDELAQNINNLCKFDYKEMGCEMKKDFVQQHRLFYGIGIEVFDEWNEITSTPGYKVVNPMCRVPDIYQDINTGPRYHGFELQANKRDLTEENGFFNIELISEGNDYSSLNYKKQFYSQNERELSTPTGGDIINLYYHYTIFDGKKYLVVLANNKSLLIKFQEILPVTKLEKKDPTKIKFPVVVRNYRYLEDDPYGISIPDILEDKQSMIQLFYNLNRIKAEHDAYGDIFMVDDEVIDIKQLQIPILGPKYIKANLRKNPNPIMEVQRSSISQSSYDMPGILKNQASMDVGLDERSLGVQGDSNITATENQRIQKNANLKLIYGAKLDGIAEKLFWELWYRFYQENFKAGNKKAFRLNTKLGSDYFELDRGQVVTLKNMDVEVITETEAQERKEKERMGLMATINYVLQNPESSKYSKATALRQMALLNGSPQEYVDIWYPPSIEELNAMSDVPLLNADEDPKPIDSLDEDHWTYVIIYQRAKDTNAKFKAIEKRKQAIILSGQAKGQAPTEVQNGNMQNQITSQMMQQQASAPGQATSLSLTR